MAWTLKVNNSWTSGQKKNLQRMLNTFGFTDGEGNALGEDGMIGPKTMAAIQKLNRYQSESSAPGSETRALQKQLNEFGFKDAAGKSLKEDGVWGPKTDAASNDFENNFLDGVTDGKNTAKTVQKNIYPPLPKITQKDVEGVITPKAAPDPMASQKNPDGTWKQVAAPGAWSGSGGTSAKEQALLSKALEAQRKTAAQNAGRTQSGYQETGGAQGQAVTAPGTGNEGMDMLLGKGKYAGVYNNLNRPFDILISGKNAFGVNIPNSANMMYNEADKNNSGNTAGIHPLSVSGTSTAQENQKNPDGTWKQVAAPGAWSGSGGTTPNDRALLEKAKAAQDMTRRIKEGQVKYGYQETGGAQGQAITSKKADAQENQKNDDGTWKQVAAPGAWSGSDIVSTNPTIIKNRITAEGATNLSDPKNTYTIKAIQKALGMAEDGQWTPTLMNRLEDFLISKKDQLDSSLVLSEKNIDTLFNDSDTSQKNPSPLFDSAEDAARDFAEKAVKLTDKNNIEYSAIMITVDVPEYENGKLVIKTKYTYGDITPGVHNNVIFNTLVGLLIPNEGKKYLLHSHPNCSGHLSSKFSGTPNWLEKSEDIPKGLNKLGDATIPTVFGEDSAFMTLINQLVNIGSLGRLGASGYDGIYLAAPAGELYLYEGFGDEGYHASTYEDFTALEPVAEDFPAVTRYWDEETNTYLPVYWAG